MRVRTHGAHPEFEVECVGASELEGNTCTVTARAASLLGRHPPQPGAPAEIDFLVRR